MRRLGFLLVLGACSRVETAEDAARIYVDAHNRGDGGGIYDLLARRDRAAWEDWDSGLPNMPGTTESDSPRQRFAAWMQKSWTSDRGKATIVNLRAEVDRAVAALDIGGVKVDLHLVKEDGKWRLTFFSDR